MLKQVNELTDRYSANVPVVETHQFSVPLRGPCVVPLQPRQLISWERRRENCSLALLLVDVNLKPKEIIESCILK